MDHTALLCTTALGLLLFGLGIVISLMRFFKKALSGTPQDPANMLYKVVRAHGNTAEYAPFFAVLFLYLGTRSPAASTIWLMVAATACRVLVVIGIVAWPTMAKPNPARFVGALGTYAAGIALCLAMLRGA
jgi:hypothetical protein